MNDLGRRDGAGDDLDRVAGPEDGQPVVAYAGRDLAGLLQRIGDLVAEARPMPLSASVLVNRDEVLDLLDEAVARLPEELREARWLLKERDEFLARAQREADDIVAAARTQAERMVQRTEVVRAAQHAARSLVEDAEAESRRLRREAEDYCDRKLAQLEQVLDRTLATVRAGRTRLQSVPPAHDVPVVVDDEGGLFDQDLA